MARPRSTAGWRASRTSSSGGRAGSSATRTCIRSSPAAASAGSSSTSSREGRASSRRTGPRASGSSSSARTSSVTTARRTCSPLAASTTFAAASGWSSTSPTTMRHPSGPTASSSGHSTSSATDVSSTPRSRRHLPRSGGTRRDPYDGWRERVFDRPRFDPSLVPVAWDVAQGEIAGLSLNFPKRMGDWGWIGAIGVRRAWRRRGLGPRAPPRLVPALPRVRRDASSRSASTPRTRRAPCACTSTRGCAFSGGRTSGRRSFGPVPDAHPPRARPSTTSTQWSR